MSEPSELEDRDLQRMAHEQEALLDDLRAEIARRGPEDPAFELGLRAVAVTQEIQARLWSEMVVRTAVEAVREHVEGQEP